MIPNNIGEDPNGTFIGPIGSVAPWSIVQNGSSGGANTGASTATAQPIHAGLLTTRCCARFVCSDNRLVSSKLRLSLDPYGCFRVWGRTPGFVTRPNGSGWIRLLVESESSPALTTELLQMRRICCIHCTMESLIVFLIHTRMSVQALAICISTSIHFPSRRS